MAPKRMRTTKMVTEEMALTNCAFVNAADFPADRIRHVEIKTGPAHRFVFSILNHPSISVGAIAFSMPQRRWAQLSLDQEIEVQPHSMNIKNQFICAITLTTDFYQKKAQSSEPYDTDAMALEFLMQFTRRAFTVGQELVFQFRSDKLRLILVVKEIEAASFDMQPKGSGQAEAVQVVCGELMPNSSVVFEKSEGSNIILIGKCKGKQAYQSIINPDWNFEKMGIGGLDTEFSAIFRRAFASRVFPPDFIEQLGLKHVRGILLYGPPGTGKTLMARQIGKMLNAREPKIVNGPQILDKYVGESEANIRKLFADAEEEFKRVGINSGLHIIILDELDAICKQRGSIAGSTAVHDTVVNQLLAKIDGVEQLNNILVIGMTNRRDMIDDALLRPGRFEVQMEIGLPDEHGRLQILSIHTARMREFGKLASDVDLSELAASTKNFSGAEIEGLVRAAQSSAMNRLIKATSKVTIDPDAIEKLLVNREDFLYALENDVKPAFGHSYDDIERLLRGGIIIWDDSVHQLIENGDLLVEQAKSPDCRGLVSVLLEGPPNSGKTALAAHIAKKSDFPFIKVVSPEDMVGYSETAKCAMLRKAFDDAYKSPLSILLIDNLERLIDYGRIGPRYSNLVLQALLVLIKKQPPKNKRLLIIATTSQRTVMEELEVLPAFSRVLHCSPLTVGAQVVCVIEQGDAFDAKDFVTLQKMLDQKRCMIGIKKLLDIIDLSKQSAEQFRVAFFMSKLEEESGYDFVG
uniref:Vesicle-fusing ATPase n=1 Tax=Trichuris muris TaxID=70415 RepID=A0A5S6QQ51_TRIMR